MTPLATSAAVCRPALAKRPARRSVRRTAAHLPQALSSVADLRAAETEAAVARWLAKRGEREVRPVWLAASPGNNGSDALIAAAELLQFGVQGEVCLPVEPKSENAREAGVPISPEPLASLDAYGWVRRRPCWDGPGAARGGPVRGARRALSARLARPRSRARARCAERH